MITVALFSIVTVLAIIGYSLTEIKEELGRVASALETLNDSKKI